MAATLYAAAYALTTLLSVAITWRAVRARPRQGAVWLAVAMAGVTWWSAMKFFEALVLASELHLLFNALHWFGIWGVAIGVLGFGLSLSGRGDVLTPMRVVALSIVPAAAGIAWLLDPRVVAILVPRTPPALTAAIDAVADAWLWFRWVAIGYDWGLVLVGTVFVFEVAIERPRRDPSRVLLLVMIAAPLTVNVLYELGVIRGVRLDPTVFGFVVTGLAGIAVVDRFRLFDVPFARTQIVEQLSTPVLVYGHDGRLYDYNERAARLLGIESDDLDSDVREVLAETPLSLPDSVLDADARLADELDGAHLPMPTPNSDRVRDGTDGDTRHFLARVAPLDSGGVRELGYTLQLSDFTEQYRHRQRIEEQNARLEQFASVVSHDLRNPLDVATGRVELARADHDGENEHLASAARAHDRMAALIDDLLTLARQGDRVEETELLSVESFVAACAEGVELADATLDVRTDRRIEADPNRLRQCFENLLRNAIEHGGDEVTITIGEIDDEGFYVADDGPGIPADERERVFESGYSTADDGTGFGLAIVSEVVDAHGWEIGVTESEDSGARFEVTGVDLQ